MSILRRISYWAAIGFLAYMPFHIFLSQSLSLTTGGLEAWKVAKDVVLVLVTLFTICLILQQKRDTPLFRWLVVIGIAYLGVHGLLWAFHPDLYERSAILGIIYNTRLPALLVLGYGAALLNPDKFVFSSVLKIVLGVSTVVAALGVLQYFMPKDILTHFGYSLERGVRPAFFIDDNPGLPRIMSTLREPNALAAYLVLPLTALFVLYLRVRDRRRQMVIGLSWLLHAAALILTFSRSAWLGALLSLALVVWWQCSSVFVPILRRWWPVAVGGLVLVGVLIATQLNNQFVKSYITHSAPEQVQDLDSNDYHLLFIRQGIEGVIAQPLGHGPGTAGLVSIQNPDGSFLTENYYIQIGYEVGLVGLATFIALSVLVYVRLYRRHDYVAVILLASFWAYVVTNMLLHTWSNEAVATQWWLLAGMGLVGVREIATRRIK